MDKMIFAEKLTRWMDYAKANRIRKMEAWPFWLQFTRMIGYNVPPLYFWRSANIYIYYFLAAFIPWIALVQYFTRNFIYNGNTIHWDNIGISLGICLPIAVLLGWNICHKRQKLNLGSWENF